MGHPGNVFQEQVRIVDLDQPQDPESDALCHLWRLYIHPLPSLAGACLHGKALLLSGLVTRGDLALMSLIFESGSSTMQI